jgi:predicted ATP-grasp superfamily ATP-dependent carboligase
MALRDRRQRGRARGGATTPTLILDEAGALVAAEQARFSALQAQATTIIAAVGVMAGIGATLLAGLQGRRFEAVVLLLGTPVSLVLIAAVLVGILTITGLLAAGFYLEFRRFGRN